MGNRCCNCARFSASPIPRKIVLLLVGLDNSGKTTAAKGLTGELVQNAIPTIGFSSVKMKHKGYDVIIYDLGGGPQIRGIWSCYFHDVHGVIFVVDASDRSRLEEARILLYNLLNHEKLAGKPLLVLANKQDVPHALDEIDIVEALSLESLVNQQKCLTLVEVCSALSPEDNEKVDGRLVRGYRWLVRQVINNYDELSERVDRDMKEAHAAELAQKEEWKKRRSMETENQISTHQSKRPANGNLPPVEETNGVSHSPPRFSHRLKAQVEMADRPKSRRSNKVFPGAVNVKKEPESHYDESSMIVRALASPPKSNGRTGLCVHQRPFTSKSLGNGEVKHWGLDQELVLIDRQTDLSPSAHPEDSAQVEYFKVNGHTNGLTSHDPPRRY